MALRRVRFHVRHARQPQGLEELSTWTKQGYIPADANGVDPQGAVDRFAKSQGVFLVDGTWDSAKINTGLGKGASSTASTAR
ncbi:hypothetical protein ACWDRB_54895 [Nonomuraea sp. NPDC003707]